MRIYTLTIIKETTDEFPTVETKLYANPEDAVEAYGKAFDDAQEIVNSYKDAHEDDEVATDTPYRWWRAYDYLGIKSITIELEVKEVM